MAAKRKSRSDEGQAIQGNSAHAASNMTAPRRSRRIRGLPPLIHAQDENTSTDQVQKVGKYEVPTEYAPTLRCIFAKHGDIASNSHFPQYNSFLLMLVGLVVLKLQTNNFGYVLSKLDNMKNLVQFAKSGNLNVSWLLKHLVEIEKIRTLTTMAATREFDARKKIIMTAKKQFKEVQRRFDDLADDSAEVDYEQ